MLFRSYKKKVARELSYFTNLKTASANLALDSYKLLMLPVWMTTYPYEGKEHLILINGQSRAVRGETPSTATRKNNGGLKGWLDDMLDF